jgi:hypothetical protein
MSRTFLAIFLALIAFTSAAKLRQVTPMCEISTNLTTFDYTSDPYLNNIFSTINSSPSHLQSMIFNRLQSLNGQSFNIGSRMLLSNVNFLSYNHLANQATLYKSLNHYIMVIDIEGASLSVNGHLTRTTRNGNNLESDFTLDVTNANYRMELEFNPDFTLLPDCSRIYLTSKPTISLNLLNLTRNGQPLTYNPRMWRRIRSRMLRHLEYYWFRTVLTRDFFLTTFTR